MHVIELMEDPQTRETIDQVAAQLPEDVGDDRVRASGGRPTYRQLVAGLMVVFAYAIAVGGASLSQPQWRDLISEWEQHMESPYGRPQPPSRRLVGGGGAEPKWLPAA